MNKEQLKEFFAKSKIEAEEKAKRESEFKIIKRELTVEILRQKIVALEYIKQDLVGIDKKKPTKRLTSKMQVRLTKEPCEEIQYLGDLSSPYGWVKSERTINFTVQASTSVQSGYKDKYDYDIRVESEEKDSDEVYIYLDDEGLMREELIIQRINERVENLKNRIVSIEEISNELISEKVEEFKELEKQIENFKNSLSSDLRRAVQKEVSSQTIKW